MKQELPVHLGKEDETSAAFMAKVNGVASCAIFCLCSISMVLLNKFITTSVAPEYRDEMPNIFIVWFQCVIAIFLLQAGHMAGYVDLPVMDWATVRAWLPINLLFIAMLVTSFLSFVYLSVPMITIIKNVTNVMTVSGDCFFFGERYIPLYTPYMPPDA